MLTYAGEYKIALVEYQPPNEFGQDGYAPALTNFSQRRISTPSLSMLTHSAVSFNTDVC
jgi:hypothetical protein